MKRHFFLILLSLIFLTEGVAMSETFKPVEPKTPMSFEDKVYTAKIVTSHGEIVCELNHKLAPLSVTNFVYLAENGFYNNLTFHRVEPNFVIQGGDPEGTGRGGPGYTIKGETKNGLTHTEGALAWARLPDQVNPEQRSSGSQFYITLAPTPFLDAQYTVFGKVLSGMDVVKKVVRGDKILKVTIEKK